MPARAAASRAARERPLWLLGKTVAKAVVWFQGRRTSSGMYEESDAPLSLYGVGGCHGWVKPGVPILGKQLIV